MPGVLRLFRAASASPLTHSPPSTMSTTENSASTAEAITSVPIGPRNSLKPVTASATGVPLCGVPMVVTEATSCGATPAT